MGARFIPRFLSSLSFIFILFLVSTSSIVAQGSDVVETCDDSGHCYTGLEQIAVIFRNVVSILGVVGGFLAFIALIIGGFRYLTARGDPKAIASAQGIITYAIIGVAFIIISWLILQFIAQFTGLPLTTFCIWPDCPAI
jgi:hypothetical protein